MMNSNHFSLAFLIMLASLLSSCASLPGNADSPIVRVVGIEPLPQEGLEARFALKLRVQNPNESDLAYDGLSIKLDIAGRGLASGVSNDNGYIPRFSETVLTIPVSISAFSIFRQVLALADGANREKNALNEPLAYKLTGKLGAPQGSFRATRFSDSGELDFFATNDDESLVE